jgi:pimeloyl-ACP methyl ester carboxylesterase
MASALGVSSEDVAAFAAGMRAIPPKVFRRAFCQAQDVRITAAHLRADAPTLLVAGAHDPRATRESNATLAALLPRAEARFLPGAGHAWMASRPELHVQMVHAWIAGEPLPHELRPETGTAR